jgi:hypothetical protein
MSQSNKDVYKLLDESQAQVNHHESVQQNAHNLRNNPAVANVVQRVASALAALRAQKTVRCSSYWHPKKEGANKKNAREALLTAIELFVSSPRVRTLREDKRYYDLEGPHRQEPTKLVFNVLTDDDVQSLINSYGSFMKRNKQGKYEVPRYLRILSRNQNLGVPPDHWEHVAQSIHENSWNADDFYQCLEHARQKSNRKANKHYRDNPQDTRPPVQLVEENVLPSVMEIAWQTLLERVFKTVHNGCVRVNYHWDIHGSLPNGVQSKDVIDVSQEAARLRQATRVYLQWSYYRKRQMYLFDRNNPSQAYKRVRDEGKRLVRDMIDTKAINVEFQNVPFLTGEDLLPLVRLRLKRRSRPVIRAPDVTKRIFPQLATRLRQQFERSYEEKLYRITQKDDAREPQQQSRPRPPNVKEEYQQNIQLARTQPPDYVPDTQYRAISLCHTPHVKKNMLNSIVGEGTMLNEFHRVMLFNGQRELSNTSPRLMEHEQTRRQLYLSLEVYVPSTLTDREDNELERVVYQFNQT